MKKDGAKPIGAVKRRDVLKGAGVGAAALTFPAVMAPRKTRAAEKLVVRDPGGPFEKAFQEAFYKPFTKETGIEIVGVTGQHEPVALIKGMVETKAYQWDCTILGYSTQETLRTQNFLEELKLDNDPTVAEIPKEFRTPTMVGSDVYSTVLAYRTDFYPAKAKAPTGGWKDLWDIQGVPGRRGMRKYPHDTMEEALLADGVPGDKLYPLDIDRAFNSLAKIKKDIAIWWSGGAQTSQMLKTGEVDMCATWNGRAQAAIDDGGPVAISWNQGLWAYEGWCIPKGAPKIDLARKFISFCSRADRQAAYTPFLAYGPPNPGAFKHIDAKRAPLLPTFPDNFKQMYRIDAAWWGTVQEKVLERFNQWMLT
jgi:putative spermidine/putrescine transport system substrate-binding protein